MAGTYSTTLATAGGTGSHPFDAALADSRLLAWGRPVLALVARRWQVLLVGAIAIAAANLLSPHLAFGSLVLGSGIVPRLVDWLIGLTTGSFVFAASYAALARREGVAYGIAHVEPWQSLPLRGLLLALIWSAVALVVGLIALLLGFSIIKMLGGVPGGRGGLGALLALGLYALYIVPALLFLLAPLWAGMWLRYNLSFARIVRTDESAWTAFRLAWQRVSAENWRYFSHSYLVMLAIAALALLALWLQLGASNLVTAAISTALVMIALMISVAVTFVIERVYDPSLGLQLGETSNPPGAASAPIETPPAPMPAAATVAPGAQEPLSTAEFVRLMAAPGRDPREVRTLLGRCVDKSAALTAIRPSILSLAQSTRVAEAIVLAEAALTQDARFFAADPDAIMPLAKRLAAGGRTDLAMRVLQPFVRDERSHQLHLTAALFAAHLLAQALNKPAAARQFLINLKKLYPHEPLIDQQLKRLPT